MNQPRETIYAALETLLGAATVLDANGAPQPAFQTLSRKFRDWDQVDTPELPAAFLVGSSNYASQRVAYGETSWRLKALLWIYTAHSPDSGSIPGTELNNILDAVETALKPSWAEDRQTLGGLVGHCYIEGDVLISEGQLPADTKSVALVPIVIETGI